HTRFDCDWSSDVCSSDLVSGTSFAVWAPTARSVSVVGDFNSWDGRLHPMRAIGSTGVWELFVPEVGDGTRYKFEIRPGSGGPRLDRKSVVEGKGVGVGGG